MRVQAARPALCCPAERVAVVMEVIRNKISFCSQIYINLQRPKPKSRVYGRVFTKTRIRAFWPNLDKLA